MRLITSFLAAACSAVLLSIGIPNEWYHFGSAFFGILALIPLYVGLYYTRSCKEAGIMCGIMIALTHLISSYWLVHFQDFAIFTLGASTVAYFFLGIPFGIWLYYAMHRLPANLRPFAFAVIWTLWEWFKSNGFVAYPWGTLTMTSQSLRTFIQIADITGVWGIGATIAAVSALLAELVLAVMGLTDGLSNPHGCPLKGALIFTAGLLLLSNVYGLYRLHETRVPENTLQLAIIQQNTDPWVTDAFDTNLSDIQNLTEQTIAQSETPPDLIVWSETTLIYPYNVSQSFYARVPFKESFTEFLERMNTPLLTGSPLVKNSELQESENAVYLIEPDGTINDTYSKMQLVCFAEYIPFIEHPIVKKFFNKLVGFSSGWQPGTEYKAFTLTTKEGKRIRFAAPICFEDAFPPLCARLHNQKSDILINLTNDSWSKTPSAEYQHFAIAFFRAIELRTPLVRATNSGYSAVVDPTGKIIADLPLFTATGTVVEVPLYAHRTTFYAQWQDWLPFLFLVIALAGMFSYWKNMKKQSFAA